jgi:four helix bundle protein
MVEYDSLKKDDSNDVIEFNEPQVIYDLEERSFQFAKRVRLYVKKLPVNTANIEDGRQVIRSSASVGANYIEANENLGEKDFGMHIKISRKEAKEAAFFLRLIYETNTEEFLQEGMALKQEAIELKKIMSSILEKVKKRQ